MQNIIKLLSKSEIFTVMKNAHDKEHAIEIQLPFLQEVLNDFKIVPLIVGNLTEENLAKAVQQLQKIVDDKHEFSFGKVRKIIREQTEFKCCTVFHIKKIVKIMKINKTKEENLK